MSFWFSLREGMSGFKRARLASFITISSVTLALFLVGVFILFSVNINQWISEKRAKMELEVFLDPALDKAKAENIALKLKKIKGIARVQYVSKEDAARRFEKEFGRNIYDVLESNPLPPSCRIFLKESYQTATAIRQLEQQMGKIDGVTDIQYARDLIALIDHYISWIFLILGVFGFILLLIAVVLLYNTIRLTIFARRDIIEIMELVGATAAFIKRPFVVEGFLQGTIGAVFAAGLLYLISYGLKRIVFQNLLVQPEIYLLLIAAGALIGMVSSIFSLSRYLDHI